MKLSIKGLVWLMPWLVASSPLQTDEPLAGPDGSIHGNHIFNALHNSMKMFGCVLQHNGMSIFIATVPQGTEFYHGTSSPYRKNGTGWLAFEPEHAMAFAHPRQSHRAGPKDATDEPHDDQDTSKDHRYHHTRSLEHNDRQDDHDNHKESSFGSSSDMDKTQSALGPEQPTTEERSGYFHTYRTKREMRLVYFDGQSAAKSLKGTLDMQDIVLRNATWFDGSPAEGDNVRADELCALARDRWDNRVDGFIRMVGGFEIILCSFADNLDVKCILSTSSGGGGSSLNYARALATRFDGIGGDRVSINYADFVSLLAFPDAVYFDERGLPRAINDWANLGNVRHHIDRLITQLDSPNPINWQNIVDMIVTRYHYRINLMLSSAISTHHELQRELHLAIEPFVDAHARNSDLEIERCATQFWISGADLSTTPAQAVYEVSKQLCSALVTGAAAETYEEGIAIIQDLKRYLDWTDFRKCNNCKPDEICQLPIWPSGSEEDFVRPQCGAGRSHGAGGYWDMMGRVRG